MRTTLDQDAASDEALVTVLDRWLNAHPELTHIATFASLHGEPNLLPLLDTHPERRWYFPRVANRTDLTFHCIHKASQLVTAAFGIQEPTPDLPTTRVTCMDAFLCPGIAFDPHGGRLGRGRGYYDRILATARIDALRIGVCFSTQLVESTHSEPHDIRMNQIICENGIITPAAPTGIAESS